MQDFLDQRKRDKIRDKNELTIVSRGDKEISYENMSQVQLTGVSLKMVFEGHHLEFLMAAEYPPMIARRIRELIPNQRWVRSGSSFSA